MVVLAFVLQLFHAQRPACAESRVSYHGVVLAVESLRPAGPELLAIEVQGEAFLVSEKEAGRRVALRVLSATDNTLSPSLVKSLAEQAAAAGDSDVVQSAVRSMVLNSAWAEFNAESAWQTVVSTTAGQEAVLQTLEARSGSISAERMCAVLNALTGAAAPLQKAKDLAGTYAATCVQQALEQSLTRVFQGSDIDGEVAVVERALQAYRPAPELLATAQGVLPTLRQLNRELAASEATPFLRSLETLQVQAAQFVKDSSTLTPIKFVERFMQESSKKEQYATTLQVVSGLDFEKRTPVVHQYIFQALGGLPADDAVKIFSPDFHAVIDKFATKDDQIGRQYMAMMNRVVSELLKAARAHEAYELVMNAQGLPDTTRNLLRDSAERVATAYLDQGEREGAKAIIASFVPAASFMTRLRIRLAALGLTLGRFFILLAVVAVGITVAVRRFSKKRPKTAQKGAEAIRQSASADFATPPPPPPEEKIARPSAEYREALRVFGLELGATLADIKNAYRQAVKEHHPDAKQNPTKQDNDYFIILTTAYERLLELHDKEENRVA